MCSPTLHINFTVLHMKCRSHTRQNGILFMPKLHVHVVVLVNAVHINTKKLVAHSGTQWWPLTHPDFENPFELHLKQLVYTLDGYVGEVGVVQHACQQTEVLAGAGGVLLGNRLGGALKYKSKHIVAESYCSHFV